jgi:DNA-binding HxlR family transcriptional regulator
MGSNGDYCAFTKAVEHLGDRWSLVIVRDLTLRGSLGFNALADAMPGISRSVLAARLRKLEDLELIVRDRDGRPGRPVYSLTHAGRELEPVLKGLWSWSERFVPQDPAMAERDPDIVVMWLSRRIEPAVVPEQPVVIELDIGGTLTKRFWLVLEHGLQPSNCIEDPCLAADRYVYVEADVKALYPLARGTVDWAAALADRGVQLYGPPALVRALPSWFRPSRPDDNPARLATVARSPAVA